MTVVEREQVVQKVQELLTPTIDEKSLGLFKGVHPSSLLRVLENQRREKTLTEQFNARLESIPKPSERYCEIVLENAHDFQISLPDGLEMLATIVLPDGSSLRLSRVQPRGAKHVLCIGESLDGFPVQVLASCDVATLKLEAVRASEPEAKQARCGFLAQVRQNSLEIPQAPL